MDNSHSKKSFIADNKHIIIDIFGELLEVSTHLILYIVGVYPIDFFEKREKYGTSVVMSRHPQLNGYISDVIVSLKEYLKKDLVENIYILIINSKNKPIKRFVFTVKDLFQKGYNQELNFEEINILFRTTIKRLWGCADFDTPVDDDLSFQYMVKLKGEGVSGNSGDNAKFPWILAEDEYLTPIQRKEEKKIKGKEKMDEDEDEDEMDLAIDQDDDAVQPSQLLPIYSINNPSIKLQLYQEVLPS